LERRRRNSRRFILFLFLMLTADGFAQTDYTAAVDPNLVLVDNFEGWGTSLCWWANVVGGYANRSTYVALAFTQLQLNIVRYNIGGGENPGISNTMEFRARVPGFETSPGVWDWTADANQRWVLRQAVALGANRVVAFANSPPWWMTVSGSVTGSTNGTSNNLQTSDEDNFAVYLATVISNLTVLDGVTFESVSPLNEPTASWWKYGGRQEGCHISSDQQARVVNYLRTELNARNQSAGIVASEDNDEQSAINSLNVYNTTARSNVMRVVSHTYGANNPVGLRNLAAGWRKPLWVSEYGDGDASGLTMARRIRNDIALMWARAWVYWQVVDSGGGWGMLSNPEDGSGNTGFTINRKFYVMGQFSQFIRPGCRIINVGDTNSLAAYNPTNHTLTIVTVNETTNSFNVTYDLGAFTNLPPQAARYRTSPSETLLALSPLSLSGRQFTSAIVAQSVTSHVLTNVIPTAPSSQPQAWYRFEGNAQDATGHGNDGVISGNVTFVTGKLGAQAAQFDGTSSYVQIPRSISNHFTISFWVKTTATASTGQWWAGKGLVDGEVSGTVDDFGVALVGGRAALGIGNPDTTITSTGSVNDGQWHHVAATRDAVSGVMQLFIDGALQAATNGPTGTKAAPPFLRIGSIQQGYAGGFFPGVIDDVQLFGRVFAASEIGQLMNHPPAIQPIADTSILAGRTLSVTNTATDPDAPAQTLAWSLVSPPAGASINATSGVFVWRPLIAQSPATNDVAIVVTDNGSPAMSATQTFAVTVTRPVQPQLGAPLFAADSFTLNVNGDSGPDYIVEAATNLFPPARWLSIGTNAAASPPFIWGDSSASNFAQRFYRLRLGP
jgi:O-glycosyl hydrolase